MLGTRLVVGLALAGWLALAAVAIASGPVDIGKGGDLHESVGQADGKTKLQRGVVYRASDFPLALRVRAPDALWGGVQLRSGRFRFVQIFHLHAGSFPTAGRGDITFETATGRTPSIAATVSRLHSTPLIKAGAITPIRLAGFSGKSFDAEIVGRDPGNRGISLAPFTVNRHCGYCEVTMRGETQDYKFAGDGQLFRIIALGVRGKTVVIYLESGYADQPRFPPERSFPTFLPFAKRMLSTLTFLR